MRALNEMKGKSFLILAASFFEFQILGNAVNPSIDSDNDRLEEADETNLRFCLDLRNQPKQANKKHESIK